MKHSFPAISGRFGAVVALALFTSSFAQAGGGHGCCFGGGHCCYGGHGCYGCGHGCYGIGIGFGCGWGCGYGCGWGYGPVCYPAYGCAPAVVAPAVLVANGGDGPANLPGDACAHLTVHLPRPDAVVLLNGSRTEQTDAVRRFKTPALTPGKDYSYEIQVQWLQDGRPVEQIRTVTVQAGARVNVDLATVAATPATASIARLAVAVPTNDAEVWLNGTRTDQTGLNRKFKSPVLTPGQKYAYEVRARWTEEGRTREATRTVVVEAGNQLNIDLTPAATTARK